MLISYIERYESKRELSGSRFVIFSGLVYDFGKLNIFGFEIDMGLMTKSNSIGFQRKENII